MGCRLDNRTAHWLLLAIAWAVLCLPGLGQPSLWDIDEGNNASAGREMFQSGSWIVPTFNYQTRYDKPALLYWLQAGAYAVCGINEFAARLPSALAALLAVLLTYEFGRVLFGRGAGLLGGLVLASCISFCASAHFANPDALLNLFTTLSLFAFWQDYSGRGRTWSIVAGAAAGMAVLAKGPVGVVLPVAVSVLVLLWQRRLAFLKDRRSLMAAGAFCLVALPWYLWVGAETKGEWLLQFWLRHNYGRTTTALEGHRGGVWYYALALFGGLAPWSIFLGPTGWLAWRGLWNHEDGAGRPAFQLLLCWFGVYFVFFTLVRTKLPNYILPAYPAVAIMTGSFLDRWRRGEVSLPAWVMRTSLVCLALMGVAIGVGMLIAGGTIRLHVMRERYLPGVQVCGALGLVWIIGAALASRCLRRSWHGGLLACISAAAVSFSAAAASWGSVVVDRHKAVRPLVAALPSDQKFRDVRVATLDYFQPSLVFYCGREVKQLNQWWQLLDFLQVPLPRYAFLPAELWDRLRHGPYCSASCRILARHYDLYAGADIVLITNDDSSRCVESSPPGMVGP